MDIKKLLENPLIPLISFADVLYNWGDRIVKAFGMGHQSLDLFGGINWFDVVIRGGMAYAIWWLYRKYRRHEEKQRKELQFLKDRIIEAIRALQKINSNEHEVLIQLWLESRDRSNGNMEVISKVLADLTGKRVIVRPESPEISKYKGVLNAKLDEIEDPLYKIIEDWEKNTKYIN